MPFTFITPRSTLGHVPHNSVKTPMPIERGLCLRCLRAQTVCLCAEIRPITPSFRVVLLQHPKERKNTIGTARLTHLCISNSVLIPGVEFDQDHGVNALIDDPGNFCVTLFPGEHSINVSEHAADFFAYRMSDDSRILTVFVIDGTWANAKSMLRKSIRLASLPQIRFTPTTPSNYRVRKQPNRFCLSTIEAVHQLIRVLNPEKNPDILVQLFGKMVDRQIECAKNANLRELKYP